MKKHLVIQNTSASLLGVIQAELAKQKSRAKVVLGVPGNALFERRKSELCLCLYQVRPYQTQRNEPWEEEVDEPGSNGEVTVVKYGHPLDLDLHYLVTAADDDPGQQQTLLAIAMKAFLEHASLSGEWLVGQSWRANEAVPVEYDEHWTPERQALFWQSLGTPMRLSAGYVARARLHSERELGRTKRVQSRVIDLLNPNRVS